MIIVNTPHNPIGKVFTRTELEAIAAIAEEFNLLIMSDEVVSYHKSSRSSCLPILSPSMTALFLMERSTSTSPIYQACGTAR